MSWTEAEIRAAIDEVSTRPERLLACAEAHAWVAVRQLLIAMRDRLGELPPDLLPLINETADRIAVATDAKERVKKARALRSKVVLS